MNTPPNVKHASNIVIDGAKERTNPPLPPGLHDRFPLTPPITPDTSPLTSLHGSHPLTRHKKTPACAPVITPLAKAQLKDMLPISPPNTDCSPDTSNISATKRNNYSPSGQKTSTESKLTGPFFESDFRFSHSFTNESPLPTPKIPSDLDLDLKLDDAFSSPSSGSEGGDRNSLDRQRGSSWEAYGDGFYFDPFKGFNEGTFTPERRSSIVTSTLSPQNVLALSRQSTGGYDSRAGTPQNSVASRSRSSSSVGKEEVGERVRSKRTSPTLERERLRQVSVASTEYSSTTSSSGFEGLSILGGDDVVVLSGSGRGMETQPQWLERPHPNRDDTSETLVVQRGMKALTIRNPTELKGAPSLETATPTPRARSFPPDVTSQTTMANVKHDPFPVAPALEQTQREDSSIHPSLSHQNQVLQSFLARAKPWSAQTNLGATSDHSSSTRMSGFGLGLTAFPTPSPIKSSRYLKVWNVKSQATADDLKRAFLRFGSLVGIYTSALQSQQTLILSFHDLRHADEAHSTIPRLNELSSSFEYPLGCEFVARADVEGLEAGGLSPILSKSEGLLVINGRGEDPRWSQNTLQNLLSHYGDIRFFLAESNKTYYCEFWDDREAERALSGLNGKKIGNLVLSVTYQLDTSSIQNRNTESPDLSFGTHLLPTSYIAWPYEHLHMPSSPVNSALLTAPPGLPSLSTLSHPPSTTPSTTAASMSSRSHMALSPSFTDFTGPARLPQIYQASPLAGSPCRCDAPSLPYCGDLPREEPQAALAPDASMTYRTPFGSLRADSIPERNILDLDKIEKGLDTRLTLMIKNVPNRMTDIDLMSFVDEVVPRKYDFLYLRVDFRSKANVGYGFINFIDIDSLLRFCRAKLGVKWGVFSSDKICLASYASIQGKEALIAKFRNSQVMDERVEFRPKVFHSSGPMVGLPEPFPAPDNMRRKARSKENAANLGLFPNRVVPTRSQHSH